MSWCSTRLRCCGAADTGTALAKSSSRIRRTRTRCISSSRTRRRGRSDGKIGTATCCDSWITWRTSIVSKAQSGGRSDPRSDPCFAITNFSRGRGSDAFPVWRGWPWTASRSARRCCRRSATSFRCFPWEGAKTTRRDLRGCPRAGTAVGPSRASWRSTCFTLRWRTEESVPGIPPRRCGCPSSAAPCRCITAARKSWR